MQIKLKKKHSEYLSDCSENVWSLKWYEFVTLSKEKYSFCSEIFQDFTDNLIKSQFGKNTIVKIYVSNKVEINFEPSQEIRKTLTTYMALKFV